ncbi:ABC transporter ATP-binding protein [Paenibacillus filicis]|uniref:ABC transporter ATP-binding protein n=1 Tax=Paenibacillus gyeongsangnamensis TaxID=3388067 RepID=A0ABT4Q5X8_9BACL|nr:ABC transporter ATP-binding protein [Paenibacillus filicis]MCZ8512197.1 ABC transporter ATP-binding protein [Paenibacillus filicis]
MSILEKLPPSVAAKTPETPLFTAMADVNEDGQLGERWLVVTEDDVCVFKPDGEQRCRIPIRQTSDCRIVSAIGGGTLTADTPEGPVALVRFTSSHAGKFGFAAKLVKALADGETAPTPSVKDLPRRCSSCGTPLLEGTEVCSVCTDKGKVAARLLKYAKPYRTQMATAALMLIAATLMELVPPYLTKVIVDDVLQPKNIGYALLWFVLGLAATRIVLSSMQTLRGYVGVWVGGKLMGDIRKDIYTSLMRLSLGFFDRRQTSQFIGRVNSDAEAMRQFLTDGVMWISGQVLMLAAIITMLISLNWKLAVYAVVPTPLIVIASLIIWPTIRARWYRHWRAINRLNMLVGDALQGIRVVKAFGQEPAEMSRYADANKELVVQNIRADGMWQGVFPLFALISTSGAILVWYFGGWMVLRDEISLGTLMAFTAYLGMFFGPLQWFSQALNWTSRAMASADRVFEIMDTPSDVPDDIEPVPMDRVRGKVVLHQISYGYEAHHPVLKNIDLSVEPGEMIGLVGHSGAGKSTLINMICRFYDPNQGHISIDGIPLKKIKQEDLRKQIGVVLQETFLFDGTITENIAYSKPDATPEEIMRAAKIANAHDFIVQLPDGYDTRVGERGHRLSGGEKQRIAIARAIVHNPRILILDEATASVDTETERQIQEAISRLVKGRTTFAIAHRLSTLRNADRLVVLDKGQIAEMGTHEELLDKKGAYYKLVEAQREVSKIRGVQG